MRILNTTLKKASERLSNRKPQRLSLALTCKTHLEILICPLNNNWEHSRMVGTGDNFCAVGVIGHGFYPFNFSINVGIGYIASKLGLPYDEAEEVNELFKKLNINFYDRENKR